MANPAISRAQVHSLAEACSDAGDAFQPTATRLVKEQRRLSRFFEENAAAVGGVEAQAAIYMLTVCQRVFEQIGGRMRKVPGRDIKAAMARINTAAADLMPADADFIARAKAVAWRAQPNLLDEVLWALYEREELKDEEVAIDTEKSALIYLLLWAAVESLDANWTPPADWSPDTAEA